MWSVEEIVMNDASVGVYQEQECTEEYVRSLNWATLLRATAAASNGSNPHTLECTS